MPGDLKLGLRLTADAKGFVGEVRVSREELERLRGGTDKAATANRNLAGSSQQAESATRGASRGFLAAHGAMVRMASGALSVNRAIHLMRTALANTARQEQAVAQVAERIRSTGGAAGYT